VNQTVAGYRVGGNPKNINWYPYFRILHCFQLLFLFLAEGQIPRPLPDYPYLDIFYGVIFLSY
jgi:hypothetical protein